MSNFFAGRCRRTLPQRFRGRVRHAKAGHLPGADLDPCRRAGDLPGGDLDPCRRAGDLPEGDLDPCVRPGPRVTLWTGTLGDRSRGGSARSARSIPRAGCPRHLDRVLRSTNRLRGERSSTMNRNLRDPDLRQTEHLATRAARVRGGNACSGQRRAARCSSRSRVSTRARRTGPKSTSHADSSICPKPTRSPESTLPSWNRVPCQDTTRSP